MRRKRGSRKKHGARRYAHLRKYQFKKKHKRKRKGHTMARKKKGAHRRRGSHRRHGARRRRFTGGGFGLKPSRDDMHLMLASAAWGFAEKNARTNADNVLNKVPKPIDQLGFTGNSALVLWVISVITKNRWARLGARAVANIASYQLGHRGTLFSQSGEHFTISGWDDDDVAEAIEAHVSGINPYGQGEGF